MTSHEQASTDAVDVAVELLQQAVSHDRTYKTDRDFATALDFAVEDTLRELLRARTPELGFLGEERGHSGERERYWCLDPIDGTANFARGLPNFGIALSLIADDTPQHGEIALPGHRERYVTRNGIAYLNGQPCRSSNTTTLRNALVAVGDFATGSGSETKNRERIAVLHHLADSVERVRMLGSAAVDFAWLAAGRLDAVVMHSNRPWDISAGVALAMSAGAIVTHQDGSTYSVAGPDVIAATPGVHASLVDLLGTPPRRQA